VAKVSGVQSLDRLRAAYERAAAYVREVEAAHPGETDAAEFWREIFADSKRRNFPEFTEMLVMRRGFTYPLADRAKVGELDVERAYAESAYAVIKPSVPEDWFGRVHESAVGAPVCFEIDGHMLTGGGIVNALTAFRIAHWVDRAGLAGRPLRVLEIGAGYGQVAAQLSQVLDIESYTFIDLVENLFLTAYYLQANLPDRSVEFIGPAGRSAQHGQLTFLATPFIDDVDGPFDLIINSYSFQEMDLESVERYFGLAERTLADDGIFYSLNAHGKAGVRVPADYPLTPFRVAGLAPVRRFPWQVFATVPYELVLRKRDGIAVDEGVMRRFDGLARAMQLGLHDELEADCDALGAGGPRLDALATALQPAGAEAKRAAIAELAEPVATYLGGSLAFAGGDLVQAREHLERSVAELPATHARLRAEIGLAAIAWQNENEAERSSRTAAATALAPHLREELEALSRDPRTTQAVLASQLDLTGWDPLPGPGIARLARAKFARRARSQ
jgi:SAM-dependent methyltransferase